MLIISEIEDYVCIYIFKKTLVVNRDDNMRKVDSSSASVDLEGSSLSKSKKVKFMEIVEEFGEVFSDKPGLTRVAWVEIDADSAAPVAWKLYGCVELSRGLSIIAFVKCWRMR